MPNKISVFKLLSRQLVRESSAIRARSASTGARETAILLILSVLRDADMPPAAAQEIAREHSQLAEALYGSGFEFLAGFASEVISDIARRGNVTVLKAA